MRTLPATMIQILSPFTPLFSKRVWQHAQVLLAGAILAPGRRTVSSALRAVGLDQQEPFHRYHRVLSRATWSPTKASRILLGALVQTLAPEGPLVVGIDETLERRRGEKDHCKGSLPRPGALNPRALRKDERPQMDLRGAFGGGYVGFSGLGPAVSVGVGLLRMLRQRAGQAAQETDRVGVAATSFGEALVPRARDRRRRRSCLRIAEAARPLPTFEKADHLHYPLALRCCPLRTSSATTPRSER